MSGPLPRSGHYAAALVGRILAFHPHPRIGLLKVWHVPQRPQTPDAEATLETGFQVPTLVFGEFLSGDNFNDTKASIHRGP